MSIYVFDVCDIFTHFMYADIVYLGLLGQLFHIDAILLLVLISDFT